MSRYRGIIFDCDGVLFESHRANLAYYNVVLEQLGEPLVDEQDEEKTNLCHTAASPQVFEALLGAERGAQALDIASKMDYRQFIPFMTPEPGMAQALAALARVMPLGVATNRGSSMPEILGHFDLARHFSVVVTSRCVKRPKPHPDMLLLASERLAIDRGDLLFVGDSILDYEAARDAEMPFASYKWQARGAMHVSGFNELVALAIAI